MVIDTDVVKAKAKSLLHRLALIVIGAAAGLSSTVHDKTQDYLEKTKDLPAIVEEASQDALSGAAAAGQEALVNTQAKADQIVTKIGKTAVKAGKKVDAAAKVVSKKIQDKLKPLDELGARIGAPIPKPKPVEPKPKRNFNNLLDPLG
jgi:hypothetical protein